MSEPGNVAGFLVAGQREWARSIKQTRADGAPAKRDYARFRKGCNIFEGVRRISGKGRPIDTLPLRAVTSIHG
jgi:hypothetical protein